jgi:FAD/FMN-containing dehydrogenase
MDNFVIELQSRLTPSAVIVTLETNHYQERIKRWSAAAEKQAVCCPFLKGCIKKHESNTMNAIIVFPACTDDVATVIRLLVRYGIKEFAVRGGGHTTSGSSSTDGVCIDLPFLKHIDVNPQAKILTAQGGCLWEELDSAAEIHGLAVIGWL